MSTIAIGTAVAVGAGASPLLMVLFAGVVAFGMIASRSGMAVCGQAGSEYRHSKEELLQFNTKITREMTALIDEVADVEEKNRIRSQLNAASNRLRADIEGNREVMPDAVFREIRQKILSVRMDESMICSLNDEFQQIGCALRGNILPGFLPEWDELQSEWQKTHPLPLQNKVKSLTTLMNRARAFARQAAHAAKISLTGLSEETYTIPAIAYPQDKGGENFASLVSDIVEFGARVAFLDANEARKLRPLIDEAVAGETGRTDADEFRLRAIRQEIRMRYGKLKEQKVLTAMFRQDILDALPLVKRARGAEALIVRMEELLSAGEIPRETFMPLYENVKTLLAGQLENITDGIVAEKVGDVLSEMGYTLLDNGGRELLTAREVHFIESPYEGYRVKVKVDGGGTLTTRLVRVVGSEEEKNSVGEYQGQKDIEIGRRWCQDLEAFHETMKARGIEFRTAFRQEPEERPLEILVSADANRKKKRTKKTQAGNDKTFLTELL